MGEDDSSSPEKPKGNEDYGRLMVAGEAPHGPMELIHRFFEAKRPKSSQNATNVDTGAPSTETATGVAIGGEEEEVREAIARELGNIVLEQAQIEESHQRLLADGYWDDYGWKDEKDAGWVKKYIDREKGKEEFGEIDVVCDQGNGMNPVRVDQGSWGPMELIHLFLETKRSKSSQNAKNLEIGAPSMGTAAGVTAEGGGTSNEEGDLRHAITRELGATAFKNAQIEPAQQRLSSESYCYHGAWAGQKDTNKANDDLDGRQGEKDSVEIVAGEIGNMGSDLGNDVNARIQTCEASKKPWRRSQYAGVNYPVRGDAEDCAYYMKFGTCNYGETCKFNHLPRRIIQVLKDRSKRRNEISEKSGKAECKFYFSSGGCRYGSDCNYFHGSDKSSASQILVFNILGFPIRPGESECPYYMRTGSCKYGAYCRFHHPEPAVVAVVGSSGYNKNGDQTSGAFSSSSVPSESSSVLDVSSPHCKGPPNFISEWNSYQALPVPPAFSMNATAEIRPPLQLRHNSSFEEYPERPNEPECSFFMKTGDCKFKSSCKFNHPKNRISKTKLRPNTSSLNDKGLPLRPDQPICTHFYRYGICKYGPACKYDHSSNMDDDEAAESSCSKEMAGDV